MGWVCDYYQKKPQEDSFIAKRVHDNCGVCHNYNGVKCDVEHKLLQGGLHVDKYFLFTWRDGREEVLPGIHVADAFSRAGYGKEDMGKLQEWKECKDNGR